MRLTVPAGFLECIVSETIHRNSNGVPLFSSFTFVRIDDYLPTATNEDTVRFKIVAFFSNYYVV